MKLTLPRSVIHTLSTLKANGFEGFIVGGCVRDILLGKKPKDWDVTTNATPEQVMAIFPDNVYENQFGTVGVKYKIQGSDGQGGAEGVRLKTAEEDKSASDKSTGQVKSGQKGVDKRINQADFTDDRTDIVEVTTYRIESKYTDKRHPDQVRFAKTLEEDLSRRDFTINAMAIRVKDVDNLLRNGENFGQTADVNLADVEIVDLFEGKDDLEAKIIRAVGNPNERFNEDALRMMRAIRFAMQLGLQVEKATWDAITKNAKNLTYISQERIKDELTKIILSDKPAEGIRMLRESGLLHYIMPEIEQGIGVMQGYHHLHGPYPTVYEHLLASVAMCPSEKLEVRLAALLHDVGKPATLGQKGSQVTFYNHEYVGAKMARLMLQRLKFSRKVVDMVILLIRNHMFYYNVDEVGESGVRRVIRKVGLEHMKDLIDVRIADRLGSGVAKAVPYKLRHFKYMVEKLSADPVSVKQLKLNGNDLMQDVGLAPGPKIGAILDVLLAKVIDKPGLNKKDTLLGLAKELMDHDLEKLRDMAKEKIEQEREKEDDIIKGKYRVK